MTLSRLRCMGVTLPALLVGMALSAGFLSALIAVSAQLVSTSIRIANHTDFLATVAHAVEVLAASAGSFENDVTNTTAGETVPKPCEPAPQPVGVWVLDIQSVPCVKGISDSLDSFVLLSNQTYSCVATCNVLPQRRRLWYWREDAWRPGDQRGALMVKEFDGRGAYGRAEMVAAGMIAWTGLRIFSNGGQEGAQLDMVWRSDESVVLAEESSVLRLRLTLFPGVVRPS